MKRNDHVGEVGTDNGAIRWLWVIACTLAVFLGLGYYIYKLPGMCTTSKASQVEHDFKSFESPLAMYRISTGSFPTTEQGLKALAEKPSTAPLPHRWLQVMKKLPPDPWGADYGYRFPGSKDPTKPEIISKGADGIANTADDLGSQDE